VESLQPIRALEARLVLIARTIEAIRVISGNINLKELIFPIFRYRHRNPVQALAQGGK
jgi:hypothetical protein